MLDAGISGLATQEAAHPWNVTAAGEVAPPPRRGRRRLARPVVILVLVTAAAIGALVAIGVFLVPLASAAGGCGGG